MATSKSFTWLLKVLNILSKPLAREGRIIDPYHLHPLNVPS